MTLQEKAREMMQKLGWDEDHDREQFYYIIDALADAAKGKFPPEQDVGRDAS